jgi:L-rhamnose mutarotase
MQRLGFKMKVFKGKEKEYKKRHDEIWPELLKAHADAGILDYSIYLDEETGSLFASLKLVDGSNLDTLAQQPIVQKWWVHMADLMVTNPDKSPEIINLQEVFRME